MGPIIGLLLAGLLVGLLGFALFRLFAAKRAPQQPRPVQFAGIGSGIQAAPGDAPAAAAVEPAQRRAISIPGFEVAPFVRVAKTSFIRLQAANDSGDLDDIRDYTTPEVYAEIAMQVKERQGAQKTEVVSLDADVVEAVVEDGHEVASVRFWGLIRENDASNPEPFDELWHVRRKAGDRKAAWLIAGIQQTA
jgi:predicted lipid-binding transport protein (Tim44 family)